MSIIIKGMEMPDSCIECPLFNGCGRTATNTMFSNVTKVAFGIKGCPLIEIPKGARLIDGNALVDSLGISDRDDYCEEIIDDAPTIFEED